VVYGDGSDGDMFKDLGRKDSHDRMLTLMSTYDDNQWGVFLFLGMLVVYRKSTHIASTTCMFIIPILLLHQIP
jgi:hypothetical protein